MTPGQPYVTVATKRSYDDVPITFDWHDYLLNLRAPGMTVVQGYTVRPRRALATGYQWVCTQAGVTSGTITALPAATKVGTTFADGSAAWTSAACDSSSFRTAIQSLVITVPTGITYMDLGQIDFTETVLVAGGVSGNSYPISCRIVCVNSEDKEAIALLPVQD